MEALGFMMRGTEMPREPEPLGKTRAHIFRNQPQQFVEGLFQRKGILLSNNMKRSW